jgi:hypothetical protein
MLAGKSIFVWQEQTIGDAGKITAALTAAGFRAVILHSAYLSSWPTPTRLALLDALQSAGIACYLGAPPYGDDPQWEGRAAARLVNQYGLAGWVADAEGYFDGQETPDSNAVHLLTTYKNLTERPVCWCWWAMYQWSDESDYPGRPMHPKKVLQAAMQYADCGMPMAYWSWGNRAADAARYLAESYRQWQDVTGKPIIPAGRAYVGDGGVPNAESVRAFDQYARGQGSPGVSWWSMQHAYKLSAVWSALSALPPYAGQPPVIQPPVPEDDMLKMKVTATALNVRSGPGTQYDPPITTLKAGAIVTVQDVAGTNGAWVKIADDDRWCCAQNAAGKYLEKI